MWVADSTFDRIQAVNGLRAKNPSQMSKLIPMLQVGTKAGPNDEQIQQTLVSRKTALERLSTEFETAVARLPSMGKVSKERQLKRLTEALTTLKALRDAKVPQGTAKGLRAVINELTSLREIAYLDELNESTVDLTAVAQFRHLLATVTATTARKLGEHAQLVAGEDTELSRDPVFGSDIAAIIAETNAKARELPTLGAEPYIVARTSILPVAKNVLLADGLARRGFTVTSLAGYPVMHSQLVLSVAPKAGTVEEVLAQLRKLTKQKLVLVHPRPIGANGSLWYWLMREAELDAFASAFAGGALQLRSWGFGTQG